ncbi:hypothetical protein PG993_014766 [Apiospora rasikravindrae]|uniref:RBR-type E3 ubiquitin transferase n=1 Tax=Apiospora rasikravindrae TaxID=990691 RepID=A0ABR1RNW5_9PEZI
MADVRQPQDPTDDGQDDWACIACGDKVPGVKTDEDERVMSCGHVYYWLCFARNVKSALRSLPFRPVRCCGQDPVPSFSIWLVQRRAKEEAGFTLSDAEVNRYILRNDEAASGSLSRVYCHRPECNAYIHTEDRTDTAGWCWICEVNTCLTCREAAHTGACDEEVLQRSKEADETLLRLAQEKGWTQCPACNAMTERIDGCNFMTCHCGQYFCYKCGIPEEDEGEHFHESDDEYGPESDEEDDEDDED